MFSFSFFSELRLSKQIKNLSMQIADEFFEYLKRDSDIYDHCINDIPIKNTTIIFIINLYRDILNSKYNEKSVYNIIYLTTKTLSTDKEISNRIWEALLSYAKQTNDILDWYKVNDNIFDSAKALTDTYFSLILDDRDYLKNELENSLRCKPSYKKIYNYIKSFENDNIILHNKYNIKLR